MQRDFTIAEVVPNTWMLNNEISYELQASMTKHKTYYYLVPPYSYRAKSEKEKYSNAISKTLQLLTPNFLLLSGLDF